MKRKQKINIVKLQKDIWELCKKITRGRYKKKCYVCDKRIYKNSDWHTAHFIPKRACNAYLKYDLRNLRPCCYHCNINLGGYGALFYRKLVIEEGQEYVDGLFADLSVEVNTSEFYPILYEKLKQTYEEDSNGIPG